MNVPYTFLEVEAIDTEYEEQVPIKVIAEHANRNFHNGNPVRTENSVWYVIRKLNDDVNWYDRLEEIWLSGSESNESA